MDYIKIIIATHKRYWMPSDSCYLPLHVGKEGKENIGYQGDNTGDNISTLNPSFCELTGLYWLWKNVSAEYKGLVHYRRHFVDSFWCSHRNAKQRILSSAKWNEILSQNVIVVPSKRYYVVETVYSHYAHTHYSSHLDVARRIVKELSPEYIESFDYVMKSSSAYMFNMFVMSEEQTNSYCSWLFPILFKLDVEIDSSSLSTFQGRYLGRVSELLFNVWIHYQQILNPQLKVKPVYYSYLEPVSITKKIKAFLKAKFFGNKYTGSF